MKRAWNDQFIVEDPHSAIGAWVTGVWRADPLQARKRLRAPILIDHELTAVDHAILKVHAKRVRRSSFEVVAEHALAQRERLPQLGTEIPPRETNAESSPRHSRDREVWAECSLLPGARVWNSNARSRLHHAEWNLLCALASEQGKAHPLEAEIPLHAEIRVSLKPCKVCAAAIWSAAERGGGLHTLRVRYLEDDPGPSAQNTLLDLNSPARRTWVKDSGLWTLSVQEGPRKPLHPEQN